MSAGVVSYRRCRREFRSQAAGVPVSPAVVPRRLLHVWKSRRANVSKIAKVLASVALSANLAFSYAVAEQHTVRIRGTIEAVDGPTIIVKSRDGQTRQKIRLTDNVAVREIIKAALTDIKENSFIGVTGMPQADGTQKAIEIRRLSRGVARYR